MIIAMTTAPTTTPITIHFQSSFDFSVVVTVAAGLVVCAEVVTLVLVVVLVGTGVAVAVVDTCVNSISEIGNPNTASRSDLTPFTTCSRAAAGIMPLPAKNDGSKI